MGTGISSGLSSGQSITSEENMFLYFCRRLLKPVADDTAEVFEFGKLWVRARGMTRNRF